MNIFMVTKPVSPFMDEGSKNLAFNLCTQLKDYKFHLMTSKSAKLPQIENIAYHYFYPNSALNVPKISLFNKIKLFYKIFNQKNIDIYHYIFTPRIASSLAAKAFFKFSKKKSIQTISTPLTKSKLRKCLFADKIVVLSEWTKNRILNLGYKNVIKINPGVNLDKFSKDKIPMIRKRFNIPKDDFVILFPSEYSIGRGTRTVLMILKKLTENFTKVKIIFACRIRNKQDLKEKKFLIKIVNKLHLENKVIFLNRISFMPELINSSDAIIFPVLSPFLKMEIPMVLLESLALKTPVIISDIPPFNEIFPKNKAGFKIRPGDTEDLFNAISKLIKNKNLKNKMGEEGRKLIEKKFDIKDVAKEYQKVYKELKKIMI